MERMTWWQTLLVAVVPVFLTLIVTNWAEGRRRRLEMDERQQEREAAESARRSERQYAVSDAWREDKMKAHHELMVFARNVWHCMVNAGKEIANLKTLDTAVTHELTPEINESLKRIHEAFRPLDLVTREMDSLVTAVQMFCSQEALGAVMRFEHQHLMQMTNLHAILNGNGSAQVGGVSFYERWDRDLIPITGFVTIEYALIVRRDLHP